MKKSVFKLETPVAFLLRDIPTFLVSKQCPLATHEGTLPDVLSGLTSNPPPLNKKEVLGKPFKCFKFRGWWKEFVLITTHTKLLLQ